MLAQLERRVDHILDNWYLGKRTENKRAENRFWCPCCANSDRASVKLSYVSVLEDDAPQRKYRKNNDPVRHFGQLKLLCSEIQLLLKYRGNTHTVIYAGAAPGTHIPTLARMFPEMNFVLVDPHPSALRNSNRIKVIQDCMTDSLAQELARRFTNILFVSDVRIGAENPRTESDYDQQVRIHNDMLSQLGWHRKLNPVASLFKFRLPWDMELQTAYLEGTIYLPIFGRQLTHESRLYVQRDAKMIMYDNKKYEGQMAYFNQVQRVARYESDRCYDCTAFRAIVKEYLGEDATPESVETMCTEIDQTLQRVTCAWEQQRPRF